MIKRLVRATNEGRFIVVGKYRYWLRVDKGWARVPEKGESVFVQAELGAGLDENLMLFGEDRAVSDTFLCAASTRYRTSVTQLPSWQMTFKQERARQSLETREEYRITVATFEDLYPERDSRNNWIDAVCDAVERGSVLKPTVLDALVEEIGEAKVLYVFRGPRMAAWPEGYMLPSVRREPKRKLLRYANRRKA